MLKNTLKMFVCILLCFFLFSCSYVEQSYADELISNVWYAENENETKVQLSFTDDNRAELKIEGDADNTCTISGVCVINETSFVISDVTMAKNISIDYKLFGNKIDLTYMGQTLTLFKK